MSTVFTTKFSEHATQAIEEEKIRAFVEQKCSNYLSDLMPMSEIMKVRPALGCAYVFACCLAQFSDTKSAASSTPIRVRDRPAEMVAPLALPVVAPRPAPLDLSRALRPLAALAPASDP
jgi:hypothetical protein